MTDFARTEKQAEIVEKVLAAADAGDFIKMTELRKQLSYGPSVSKQAILCSLWVLVEHGLVEFVYGKDRGEWKRGKSAYIKPTPEAYRQFRGSGA